MKSKLLILSLVSLSLFLSGCGFDESLESNQQHDGDDMNVIQNIWPQALDQMLRWLSVPIVSQQLPVQVIPSYVPTVVSQKTPVQTPPPIVSPEVVEPIVEPSPTPIVSEDDYDREDD